MYQSFYFYFFLIIYLLNIFSFSMIVSGNLKWTGWFLRFQVTQIIAVGCFVLYFSFLKDFGRPFFYVSFVFFIISIFLSIKNINLCDNTSFKKKPFFLIFLPLITFIFFIEFIFYQGAILILRSGV